MSDMDKPGVAYVLLYRSSKDWRTTIAEVPLALACGALPTTGRDAPFEEAAREFEAILREFYDIPDALDWRETDPDWWAANISGEAPETSER